MDNLKMVILILIVGFSISLSAQAIDVGVISSDGTCNGEKITIYMDDEDSRNGNYQLGWVGGVKSDTNTKFVFCRVNGDLLKPIYGKKNSEYNYAVLQLADRCPRYATGSFSRHFDNEDRNNGNYFIGEIYPNVSNTNTTLRFCTFHGSNSSNTMYSFPGYGGLSYGVFGSYVFVKKIADGYIYTDDEDKNNKNWHSGYGSDLDMVSSGTNTFLSMVKVR